VNPASVVGLIGGLSVVVAGVLRVIYGGQDPAGFAAAVLAGIGIFGLFIAYWLLRFRNATVYVRDGRVGLTDAFGLRHEVPTADVERMVKKVETPYTNRDRVAVLLIVSKRGKHVLRFTRADRLEPGGIERLAAAIGVQVEGSW